MPKAAMILNTHICTREEVVALSTFPGCTEKMSSTLFKAFGKLLDHRKLERIEDS